MKYFASDLHLDHTSILKESFSNRPFDTVDDMNAHILFLFSRLRKRDILYLAGDLSWSDIGYEMLFKAIPKGVDVHWIIGNHDRKAIKRYGHLATSVSHIMETRIQGHHATICHYPMLTWNRSHHNAWQLFGHHHINGHGSERLDNFVQGKMLNINIEFHNYKLWHENEIVSYMENRPDNWDLIKVE